MNMKVDIKTTRIGVVGGGAWGTAIAKLLADKGFGIDLWVFESEVREQIEKFNENQIFLPNIKLPENLVASNDLGKVVGNKDLVVMVVPSHCTRDVAGQMKEFVNPDTIIVTASKGIENKTHLTMTQILAEKIDFLPQENLAVISGPSFAKEVATKVPTVVAAASINAQVSQYIQEVFSCPTFRVYVNDDPIGTQVGGAMKNVLAIAAGICDGMKMGLNPRAALITRGLTEMNRLGIKLGANPLTLLGLAGVGDLLLTCTGALSRNYSVGIKIGEGKKLDDIISEMRMVAEGVKTTKSVYNLSKKLNIDLPICNEVYSVLFEDTPVKEAIDRLMTRSLKHELDGVLQ